ncbi:class I SAM-dependent methyltransferase [Acuticoccus kandeliae]|uniref:class I SAM-dependent methyltransferase n=1 Tax=Acuticoccus kandeliae TaxID=2073160 RepID=UPI000D3EB806|nr:class I SAM-dependent methyltransferase [Acuticoccus kandeliae]
MSRLDSFIRRMCAQRLLIEAAAARLGDVAGPILDLGLGSGRTYDHLCALFPDRDVFAFDQFVQGAFGGLPDTHHMILGEIRDTLPVCLPRIGAPAALVHNDLGSADPVANAAIGHWLAPAIEAVSRPDAIVLTSFPLPFERQIALPLPEGIRPGRYHIIQLTV